MKKYVDSVVLFIAGVCMVVGVVALVLLIDTKHGVIAKMPIVPSAFAGTF